MAGVGAAAAAKECPAPAAHGGSSGRREQPPGEGQQGFVWHLVSTESPAAGGAHHQVTETTVLLTLPRSRNRAIINIASFRSQFWCTLFFDHPSIHLFLHSYRRKLLEQREEELQQQVRSLRLKDDSTTRTNAELSHRVQQLDTRLAILEAELGKAREEVRNSVQQLITCY